MPLLIRIRISEKYSSGTVRDSHPCSLLNLSSQIPRFRRKSISFLLPMYLLFSILHYCLLFRQLQPHQRVVALRLRLRRLQCLKAIAGFSDRLNTGQKSSLPPRAPIPFAKAAIDESRFAVGRRITGGHFASLRFFPHSRRTVSILRLGILHFSKRLPSPGHGADDVRGPKDYMFQLTQ